MTLEHIVYDALLLVVILVNTCCNLNTTKKENDPIDKKHNKRRTKD